MAPTTGPVTHGIDVLDVAGWCTANLGFDPLEQVSADQRPELRGRRPVGSIDQRVDSTTAIGQLDRLAAAQQA